MGETRLDRHGKPLVAVRLYQKAEVRKRYLAQIPRWRHPLIGYLISIPVIGCALGTTMLGKYLFQNIDFPSVLLFLAVVVVALWWGVGPALFTVLLSALALDYFFVRPLGQLDLATIHGILELLPFVISGIIIAIITSQRESARLHALFAEQLAHEHADELEQANEELEQANRELEQANQLKDRFLSMASHELKTPLTTIRGQAQIMLRRLRKQKKLPEELDPVKGALEKIDEQTQRLASLVDDLLDLSSIRAGKIGLRLGDCDLREICCSVVEDQRLLTDRTITWAASSMPIIVHADKDRLNQVVVNLVSNALKYSPEDRPVHVCVEHREGFALLEVRDEGVGISQEQVEHIFETFYRAPDAESSQKKGWGLGLAICKDIVERHGGRIWCESERGKGSRFYVELPLAGVKKEDTRF